MIERFSGEMRHDGRGIDLPNAVAIDDLGLDVLLCGTIDVPRELGTTNAALAVAVAFERFGSDAFLRLRGTWAIALFERSHSRLHLASDPSGAIGIFIKRDGKTARFSAAIEALSPGELDASAIADWIEHGLWRHPERTAYREIERLPPGSAIAIESGGRVRRRPLYNFTPLTVPRELDRAAVEHEIERTLSHAIAHAELSEPVVVVASTKRLPELARLAPRSARLLPIRTRHRDRRSLGKLALPLSLSAFDELTTIAEHGGDANLISDLGARELFGETETARHAFVRSLARLVELEPSARALRQLLSRGAAIATPSLVTSEMGRAGEAIARRWSRHLPGSIADRIENALGKEVISETIVTEVTGNPFVDRRFAETKDPVLIEGHRVLARLGTTRGKKWIAPFLEPAVVELIFSLPAELFAPVGRALSATSMDSEILELAAIGAKAIGVSVAGDPARIDRLAGLGLFVS